MYEKLEDLSRMFLDLENKKESLSDRKYFKELVELEKGWARLILLDEKEQYCGTFESLGSKITLAMELFTCNNEQLILRQQISI